jgi:hypothetical protein
MDTSGVQGSGFRVQGFKGSGFKGSRVQGSGFRGSEVQGFRGSEYLYISQVLGLLY